MKKTTKIFVSLALCFTLLFTSVAGVSAAAIAEETSSGSSFMVGVADKLNTLFNNVVDGLLNHIVKMIPATYNIESVSDYTAPVIMDGHDEFLDEPAEEAQWSLGYAQASIVPADFAEGKYYKGGYDVNLIVTEMLDDLKVRVVVLDDGSGRGAVAIAAIDCLGLAQYDVGLIREALADYAAANNIVSINISATHVHSGIDTQGIYTDTANKIITNLSQAFFKGENLAPAIDESFRQLIIAKTAECVKAAFESMTTGTLTYAKTNAAEYVRDRTEPDIMIEDLYRFMFTPDDGSMGTIISNFGVHPECIGYGTQVATSDFVYYTEQIVNEAGYNFIFLQGSVGTYTEDMGASSDGLELDRIESTIRYGEEMGYILVGMTMTPDERLALLVDADREAVAADNEDYTPWYTRETVTERELAPILNVAHKEYLAPVDNGVYELLGKISCANNKMIYDENNNYFAVTEVGFMEIDDVKVILCPGETYAEILKGGENMADFAYASAYEIFGTEDVIVCDLVNDALGYIMPDSFFTYATIRYREGEGLMGITIDSSWGLTSLGNHAASNIYGAIYELAESVR